MCPELLESKKSLKAHIAVRHSRLAVICPGCHFEEKIFKRVADLKFHYVKCHPDGDLLEEAFTERNGFWMSLYSEDYLKVIQPTKRSDELARKAKAAVTKMLGASTCRRSKSHNDWYQGWEKERERYSPTTAASTTQSEVPVYTPTPLPNNPTRQTSDLVRKSQVVIVPRPVMPKHLTPERSRSATPKPAARSRPPTPVLVDQPTSPS